MSHYNKEMVSVYTNTTCNLDCKYCYTNKKSFEPQYLDIEFGKKLILDYFTRQEYKGFKPVVRFFAAGEPTMNFEAIKELVEYSKKEFGSSVEFELQSNGIYICENGEYDFKKADWIAKNIDYIWISCDGTPDVQNEYRPIYIPAFNKMPSMSSSEVAEETIKYILPRCKKMIGVRMTIISMNLYRQKEMIDYFYNLGIRDIWADPLFPSVGEKEAIEEINLDEFAKEFLKACDYASSFGVDPKNPDFDKIIYGSNYTCNFDEEVKHYCRACKPVPHATTDGYVTACDMAMFYEKEDSPSLYMNALIFGEWNAESKCIEYNEKQMNVLRARNCENMEHCQHCIAKFHCGGYCLGEVTNETGRIDGILGNKCKTVRTLYKNMNKRQRKYRYSHP